MNPGCIRAQVSIVLTTVEKGPVLEWTSEFRHTQVTIKAVLFTTGTWRNADLCPVHQSEIYSGNIALLNSPIGTLTFQRPTDCYQTETSAFVCSSVYKPDVN